MIQALTRAVLLASLAPLAAQDDDPSAVIGRAVEAGLLPEVTTRLASDDMATVAWGAHLASRHRLEAAVPALRARLAGLATTAERERRFAVAAILDALIQVGAKVPAAELRPFMRRLQMAPCLILLAREPEGNRAEFLKVYRDHDKGGVSAYWLSAGNVLAAMRSSELAIDLLSSFEQALRLTVVDAGSREIAGGMGGRIGGRRGSGRVKVPAGNPPTALYWLTTDGRHGDRLFAPGPVPTYFRRQVYTARTFGIGGGELARTDERPEIRLEWLAGMLETKRKWIRFDFSKSATLEWVDATTYEADADALRKALAKQFDDLVEWCVRAELIDADVRDALESRVVVKLDDRRTDQAEAIPRL